MIQPIYRSDGEWVAIQHKNHLFNIDREWIGFIVDGHVYEPYSGRYLGKVSQDRRLIRQRTLFPSGARFVFLAHARHLGPTGFGIPRHYVTDMLAMSENDALHTVYAPDSAVPVEPVGSTCRSCPRRDCLHRVTDPLTG